MDMSLEAEDAKDWSFRGEGADKLVLAYHGASPSYVGKVIRVEKVPTNGSQFESVCPVLSEQELLLWTDSKDAATAKSSSRTENLDQQQYLPSVMVSILGPEFVDAGVCVRASKDFLETLERNVLHQRPLWRVHTSKINTAANSVHLMSDLSAFPSGGDHPTEAPCISIEIKPKCGSLPSSEFIAEQNAIKKKVSRFQMHQALKLQEGQISQLSDYEPLDLFSGSRDRVSKALHSLFAMPLRNLRVFLNGSIIYGSMEGVGITNGTNLVDRNALEDHLRGFLRPPQADDNESFHPITSCFIDLVTETILKSGVMDLLLQLQKLDSYDVEGAIHAYYNIVSQPCLVCRGFDEEGTQRSRKYATLHSIPLEESVKIVKDYLISATANDCCLMISFRAQKGGDLESSSTGNRVYLKSADQKFEYKACFIDLDMKPLEKMEYYYKLDQKIVSSNSRMINEEENRREANWQKRKEG